MFNVLYSERLTWKYHLMDLICIPTYLCILYSIFTSHLDVTALLLTNLIGFAVIIVYLNFRILSVSVTNEYIEASYGFFSKRILISSIEDIYVKNYQFIDFLGWGIRLNRKGILAYNIMGDNYMGVLIEYVGKNNKPKKLFISSKNPDKIVDIICSNR